MAAQRQNDNNTIYQRVVGWLIPIIGGGMLSFCVWASIEIMERPNREETLRMIQDNAPYIKDRSMILEAVKQSREDSRLLRETIEANTRAIIKLEAALNR